VGTRRTRGSDSAQPTAPALVSVHPTVPSDAVQGFYQAIYDALRTKDQAQFALAYSYLSAAARQQISLDDLVRQYQGDSSIVWQWSKPSVAPNGTTATVPVLLTEYRGGSRSVGSLTWTVTNTASGWRLEHSAAALSDSDRQFAQKAAMGGRCDPDGGKDRCGPAVRAWRSDRGTGASACQNG